jgi:hypothetical protein
MRRTNRVGWGLAAILAMALLGGGAVFLVSGERLHPEWQMEVCLLPLEDLGFSKETGYDANEKGRYSTARPCRRPVHGY